MDAGQISADTSTPIGGGERAYIGDVVVTRQNDRRLETSVGEPVRNRESWTVEAIATDGSLTVSSNGGSGHVRLHAEYAGEHVRLGYAATEHGNQGDTVTVGIELATVATTQRGLYVGVTRGREDNKILVVTDSHDLAEARDILERVLASDRSDVPATTQRRRLAEMDTRPAAHPKPHEPRPEVPPWFGDLCIRVGQSLVEAQSAFRDDERRSLEMRDRLDRATLELAKADAAFEPFRPSLEAANAEVEAAQRAVWGPNNRAMSAKGFKKRALLREAYAASKTLDVARAAQSEVQAQAASAKNRFVDASRDVHQIESSVRSAHASINWEGHEDRIEWFAELEDSLDTWHRWASGRPVAEKDVAAAVEILRSASASSGDKGSQLLAKTIEVWAVDHGLALTLDLEPTTPEMSHDFGIEL